VESLVKDVLCAMPWFGWLGIVAVVSGCLTGIIQMRYQHLERMEKIRQGIDPDGRKPHELPEV
jgi:hypothetical protein